MDVHLLIYDLSHGLARQMSMGLLGFQLDALYHTSIELNGREYVYDGGIIAIVPGSSHLGQPMQKLRLGTTHLPIDVIEEYLDSLRPIFTLEAYDIFRHNCNNFTDAFSNFLVGKGIPTDISTMPQAVLDSPMGKMLFAQLTQGVSSGRPNGSILGLEQSAQACPSQVPKERVQVVSRPEDLIPALDDAMGSCAVIFFTSATCPPCKALYPIFDQLADEFDGQASFIKIDVAQPEAGPIAQAYSVSATPTFVTFLKGEQENRWTGADPASLRGNVQLLVQMAHPAHPHERLPLPSFSNPGAKPVLFPKVPPVAKLLAKMGEETAEKPEVQSLTAFIETRSREGAPNAVLPDMGRLSGLMHDSVARLAPDVLFAVVDVFRCVLVDARVSGYFAEEQAHKTVRLVLDHVNERDSPYALRLVTLQMACNLFSTPLFPDQILGHAALRKSIIQLILFSFLDYDHTSIRVAASSLLFNLALSNRRARDKRSNARLPAEDEVELAAWAVEAIDQEKSSAEALHGMLLALGHLAYGADLDGELVDLLRALDAEGTISSKSRAFPDEKLVREVADEMLGKGLARP
ncbi:hypothetical protein CDD83_2260 [Cordyceps sp. RAO-2017]|nr:hypothetical protein CDD83_2260 [Cordyceps sp. RAO-2017]